MTYQPPPEHREYDPVLRLPGHRTEVAVSDDFRRVHERAYGRVAISWQQFVQIGRTRDASALLELVTARELAQQVLCRPRDDSPRLAAIAEVARVTGGTGRKARPAAAPQKRLI